eukprot:TRINITY_DN797_c0_g1_i3.p1 TRINITY_DN797_c0_g1~~TRINITY_DN797_c0_g1_i3.p1  ORF type:complete len:744 (-),score=203.97 TRINITY_DN797_c0_g1_i3:161-2392(-)
MLGVCACVWCVLGVCPRVVHVFVTASLQELPDVSSLNTRELRELCRRFGVTQNGSVPEIRQRLRAAASAASAASAGVAEVTETLRTAASEGSVNTDDVGADTVDKAIPIHRAAKLAKKEAAKLAQERRRQARSEPELASEVPKVSEVPQVPEVSEAPEVPEPDQEEQRRKEERRALKERRAADREETLRIKREREKERMRRKREAARLGEQPAPSTSPAANEQPRKRLRSAENARAAKKAKADRMPEEREAASTSGAQAEPSNRRKSHRERRELVDETEPQPPNETAEERTFVCPCGRELPSVKALGGHRRHCSSMPASAADPAEATADGLYIDLSERGSAETPSRPKGASREPPVAVSSETPSRRTRASREPPAAAVRVTTRRKVSAEEQARKEAVKARKRERYHAQKEKTLASEREGEPEPVQAEATAPQPAAGAAQERVTRHRRLTPAEADEVLSSSSQFRELRRENAELKQSVSDLRARLEALERRAVWTPPDATDLLDAEPGYLAAASSASAPPGVSFPDPATPSLTVPADASGVDCSGRTLRHRYFALRHGISRANEAGVIVSSPDNGEKPEYGLHEKGQQEASTVDLSPVLRGGLPVRIVASPFSRTVETAAIVHARLPSGTPAPEVDANLRERYFGEFELQSNANYNRVWSADAAKGSDHTDFGAESARAVRDRAWSVVERMEQSLPTPSTVLVVSHGDTLQILQTAFVGVSPRLQRTLPHLKTCELRELTLVSA